MGFSCWRRRGFEQLLRRLLALPGSPAVLLLHWWSPLTFHGAWDAAEDQLDTIASYYDLQVICVMHAGAFSLRQGTWHADMLF